MAIKNIIAAGIGFSPGSVKFIVTLGFGIGAVAAISPDGAAKVVVFSQDPTVVVQTSRIPRVVQTSRVPKVIK